VKVAVEGRGGVPARLPHAAKETVAGIKTQPTNTPDNLLHNARDHANDSNSRPSLHDSARDLPRNSEPVAQANAEAKPENKTVTPSVPQPASTSDLIRDQVAKLATVRPLPYTFAGMASLQPSGGGSTRAQRQPQSALSGNPGSGVNPGANGFNTAQDYFRQGMSAYVGRDYETAANLLAQAVVLEPDFPEANLYLGICKLLRGSPSEAASALQKAAKEKKPPLSQAAHFFLAKAYLQLGKPADAENEFRMAAALPGRLAGESNELIQRLQDIRSESGRK
jgi:tetratricopeptide (TPR) repeat protein